MTGEHILIVFDLSEVIKKELSSGVPLWISEELEAWPERDQPVRFVQIASLHSEFIGVTAKGELHQWKWSENDPYRTAEVRVIITIPFAELVPS